MGRRHNVNPSYRTAAATSAPGVTIVAEIDVEGNIVAAIGVATSGGVVSGNVDAAGVIIVARMALMAIKTGLIDAVGKIRSANVIEYRTIPAGSLLGRIDAKGRIRSV